MIWTIVFIVLLCIICFALGAIAGIADCKARFKIPYGADEGWELCPGVITYDKFCAENGGVLEDDTGDTD